MHTFQDYLDATTHCKEERLKIARYNDIVEAQGPLWDDKFLMKGQMPVGLLKHHLAPEQAFVVTGRVFAKRTTTDGFILLVGDATGLMFLLHSPTLNERSRKVVNLLAPGDLVMAMVKTFEKPGRKAQVEVVDLYCIGVPFASFGSQLTVDRPTVDKHLMRAVVFKLVRTYLNQQGFLEIPADSHIPQRDNNAWHLMLGFPKLYSILNNHLVVNALHFDAEGMRRVLQSMTNSIQVGTEKRVWESELQILSVKEGKKTKEPVWLTDIPNIDNPTWRNAHYAKEGPEFQYKFELRCKGKVFGTTEDSTSSPLEFKKHGVIPWNAHRYEHFLHQGIPPFATMTFEIDKFAELLLE